MTDTKKSVVLTLIPAPDDPPIQNPEFQKALREFDSSLRAKGVSVSASFRTHDAINGSGWYVGAFTILLVRALAPAIKDVLVAWLNERSGRKARLKIGDIEAEARTTEEVEKLIDRAQRSTPQVALMANESGSKVENVCPECGYQFKGSGFDGIDAHWRARHDKVMPYEEAWPLIREGKYRKQPTTFVNVEAVQIEGPLWGVKVRWRDGDPVQLLPLAIARSRASEAEQAGNESLAVALRKAIAKSEERNRSGSP